MENSVQFIQVPKERGTVASAGEWSIDLLQSLEEKSIY